MVQSRPNRPNFDGFQFKVYVVLSLLMKKILIDTDPGIDDSLALLFVLASAELEVLGLTTVYGNTNVDLATANALRLLEFAGREDIPVARGASKPWQSEYNGGVPHIHGADGQGNTYAPPSHLEAIERTAAEFIVEQVLQYPDEVTLAALGPLTNLADALKMEPAIVNLIKEVVFMGGSAFGPGNATQASEANILSDPEAADFVFGHSWPMTMVGLDVTQKTFLSRADVDQLSTKSSKISNQVLGAYEFYLNFYKEVNKMDGTWVHDSSVFAYLLRPELYRIAYHALRVDMTEGPVRGKTLPSPDGETPAKWANRSKVGICIEVEAEKVVDLIKQRLLNARFP